MERVCGLTWNGCQKLWDFIDQHTIHITTHRAEKVVIKALHFNRLIKEKDNNLSYLRFCIGYCGNDYVSMLQSCISVVSIDIHWPVMIMYN